MQMMFYFRQLGDNSEGYSGTDILIVVRHAFMEPARKLMAATHFRKIISLSYVEIDQISDRTEYLNTRAYFVCMCMCAGVCVFVLYCQFSISM